MATRKHRAKLTKHKDTTSVSTQDPMVLDAIRRAAKLRGESVSKFLLAAASAEAAKVLKGDCPSCGRSMRGIKLAKRAA